MHTFNDESHCRQDSLPVLNVIAKDVMAHKKGTGAWLNYSSLSSKADGGWQFTEDRPGKPGA